MNSAIITTAQARELHAALFSHLNYLLHHSRQLEKLQFPADDPLHMAAAREFDATWRLSHDTHRLAVRLGRL